MSTKTYGHDDNLGYGYYWWIGNYKNGDEIFETIMAAGFGGQRVMVIPELKLVAVFTSKPENNTSSPQGERIESRTALHKSGKTGYRKTAVRGLVIIITTLTPALSRRRERGINLNVVIRR